MLWGREAKKSRQRSKLQRHMEKAIVIGRYRSRTAGEDLDRSSFRPEMKRLTRWSSSGMSHAERSMEDP